jgi:signal transduction histidine kinase
MTTRLFFALCLLSALAGSAAEPLRDFTALRALSHEDAAQGRPIEVEAIVLGSDPASPWNLFLHDGTAGCYVNLIPGSGAPRFPPGTRIALNGVSLPLGYYPSVGRGRARILGAGPLPVPIRLTADQVFSPTLDSAWVEVPAVVVGYEARDQRLTLDLEVYGLSFKAELPVEERAEEKVAALMQRPAWLRGVLGTIFNRQRQMTDRHFFVASLDAIVPVRLPAEVAAVPLITISQMLTAGFGPQTHIRLQGVVTQADAKGFYLRDASGSTLVYAARGSRFSPGTRVEVDGFGGVAPFRPVMRAARVEELGPDTPPAPVLFRPGRADLPAMHAELVTLEAAFLARQEGRAESILECQLGTQIFEALLPAGDGGNAALAPGDRLRLTGICELTTTHALPRIGWVDGFRLHLPGSAGVTIVSRAPWWTPQRLLVALGLTSALAALGLGGAWMLRRQVNRQLGIIGEKLRTEAVSQERDRMARDLHDTLEQQLSGVALQLDGLDDAVKSNPSAASQALLLARRMLRYTRLEARRSVWDLRSQVLEKHGLVAALQAMADASLAPAGPKITVQVSGPERRLPAAVEFHLFRIAQEAVTNALKHGGAGHIGIEVENTFDHTQLTVRDDGRGFDPEAKELSPGPHFGLLGMRERAAKIGAELRLTAAPAAGCAVIATLPALPPTPSP